MPTPALAGLLVLAKSSESLSDPRTLGAMGLVLVAAALVGVGVYRLLRNVFAARELSLIAAFATVAGLAYLGVPAAGTVTLAALALLAVVWILMALANL